MITADDDRREIEDTERGWAIEDATDGVVAFAIGNARTGNIRALFVEPAFHGRGFGDRLLGVTVERLWAQGLVRLWLTTGRTTRARGFYERRGWRVVGEAPNDQVRCESRRPDRIDRAQVPDPPAE